MLTKIAVPTRTSIYWKIILYYSKFLLQWLYSAITTYMFLWGFAGSALSYFVGHAFSTTGLDIDFVVSGRAFTRLGMAIGARDGVLNISVVITDEHACKQASHRVKNSCYTYSNFFSTYLWQSFKTTYVYPVLQKHMLIPSLYLLMVVQLMELEGLELNKGEMKQ